MRILLDENLSFKLKSKLRLIFPNLIHVSDVRLLGVEDSSIFDYAQKNNFDAIITNDEDYYWLSLLKGSPPKIIWLRTGNMTTDNLTKLLTEKHKEIDNFLLDPDEICLEIK
jgi:predicted nuclease of predicted toxin-antitoxin system